MAAARNGLVSNSRERGLVIGGRGYEPSLKLPNHWIQGVCLQKKVRRSHLKEHNERFSTIV